ncbi:hypothetical protein L1987_24447 [Smallanthus sonchifolius]|uniref:Uncharacterized protein n=1 Tax=Smallanthus sonchifolius TaxID=185202 RepID=A0ACB9ILW6_9ASTR|nr:hypothetical protein L1987_24447 [Smallanthus sonchifolius]
MWEYPLNLREQVRRACLSLGLYQIELTEYQDKGTKTHSLRWLTFQACALRGHDESSSSNNRDNFLELLQLITSYNDEVAKEGMIRERFLDLVHVRDTCSATLKTSLWKQLLHYQFDVSKIWGQGYDGASNMIGEWNGLHALVLNDCPYAYYVYCFAHGIITYLVFIINVVFASSKRHDELQKAKENEIKELLKLGEIKSRKGLNQVGTLS